MTSFRDEFELIEFPIRHKGYKQFTQPWVISLRRYFQEKIAMGLFGYVDVQLDSVQYKTAFILVGVSPKIWEKVLRPGVEEYGCVEAMRVISRNVNNNMFSLWINVKRHRAPNEFLAKVQTDG